MMGRKLDLVELAFSFFGWILVTVITFGLAALYVLPYIYYTTSIFYHQCLAQDDIQLVIDSTVVDDAADV